MQDSSEGFSLSFEDASLADGDLAAHSMRQNLEEYLLIVLPVRRATAVALQEIEAPGTRIDDPRVFATEIPISKTKPVIETVIKQFRQTAQGQSPVLF